MNDLRSYLLIMVALLFSSGILGDEVFDLAIPPSAPVPTSENLPVSPSSVPLKSDTAAMQSEQLATANSFSAPPALSEAPQPIPPITPPPVTSLPEPTPDTRPITADNGKSPAATLPPASSKPKEPEEQEKVVIVKTVVDKSEAEKAQSLEAVKLMATPRRLISFIHKAVAQNDYLSGTKGFDFSKFPQLSDAEKKDIVYQFDIILSRIFVTKLDDISDDMTHQEYTFQPNSNYPGFVIVKNKDTFQLGEKAIKLIPELYEEVRELPPVVADIDFFTSLSSQWYKVKYGLSYIQWLVLFVSLVLGYLMGVAAARLLYYLSLAPFQVWRRDPSAFNLSKKMWQPIGWLITYGLWYSTILALKMPPAISEIAGYPLKFLVLLMCMLTAIRLTNFVSVLIRVKVQEKFSKLDQILVPLFSRSMKILIICWGIVMILQQCGFSAVGLISGMGIGGIAIALAAQSTIANFFGSLTVLMDRPFVIGDWIVTSGVEGEVESVGMRSTRIRTFHNSEVTIPNHLLTTAIIDNMGRRHFRRYKTKVQVHYNTPPDLLEAFCEGVRDLILSYPNTRKDKFIVDVNELGGSSIDILLNCFFLVPDYAAEARARSILILDVLRLAQKMSIEIAYPTQTLYTTPRNEPNFQQIPSLTIEDAKQLASEIIENGLNKQR